MSDRATWLSRPEVVSSVRSVRMAAGFSYIEALVALGVGLVVLAAAITFFVHFGAALNTESDVVATQQSARIVMDELARRARQAGYGIRRADTQNASTWQRAVVHAGPYTLAFNADIDASLGALPSSVTLDFPSGPSYSGEGIGATTSGAETYVFTLDANGNDTIEAADRTETHSGSYNPANDTDNPLDFALFLEVWGFNGTDYGGVSEPLAPYLFTNATTDISFPDGTSPEPLFTYVLTEDLDEDGVLSAAECVNDVVDSCPPSSARDPLLYIWGDTDFDGQLSEAEKTALRGMEVGSATWSKNPLASGGSYSSTTLSSAIDPSDPFAYELEVASAANLGPGYHIRVGTGTSSDTFVLDEVIASGTHKAMTSTDPRDPFTAGTAVAVLPSTLLHAIRAIGITYTTIAPQSDTLAGTVAAGRIGRKGSRGLDFRVTPYHRDVEVLNAPTFANAILDMGVTADQICPLAITNACSGTASESSVRYRTFTGQQPLGFVVTDSMNNIIPGATVSFGNSTATVGALAAATGVSDAQGVADVGYSLTGLLGSDTVTATVQCVDGGGVTRTDSATNAIEIYDVQTTVAQDCSSTVSTRTPVPSAGFSVLVVSSSGPVAGHNLGLGLEFDPAYLPATPNFSALVGELVIDGTSAGTTDGDGVLAPVEFATDGSGQILGFAGMFSDAFRTGARLNLITTVPPGGCSATGGSLTNKIDFLRLDLASTEPASGCTESSPCTIEPYGRAPRLEATLTLNDAPVEAAPLTFTNTDVNPPTDGTDTAASKLIPNSGLETDVTGTGTVMVSNDGSPLITPATPLTTLVDVSTTGDPALCSSGTIASSSPRAGFIFEGPVNSCLPHMQQAWVVPDSNSRFCLHIRNDTDPEGCPMAVRGIQITVYEYDGFTVDPGVLIKNMEGGAVGASVSCSNSGAVKLFQDGCKSPKAKLNNGESWLFTDFDSCSVPGQSVPPGEWFTIHKVEFENNLDPSQPMDVTVIYECVDDCATGTLDYATFRLSTP